MTSDAKRTRQLTAIRPLRGFFKRKAGEKSFAEEWAEYKREEKELEDAKYERCFGAHHNKIPRATKDKVR